MSGGPKREDEPVPLWVRAVVFISAIGVASYWFATVSGPYRWLIELQVATVGRTWIMLSVGIVFITTVVSSVMVAEAIGALLPATKKRDAVVGETRSLASVGLVLGLVAGVAMCGASGWLALFGEVAGEPTALDLRTLGDEGATPAQYVTVTVQAQINKRVSLADEVNLSQSTHYVPVAPGAEGQPVRLFVKVSEDQLERAESALPSGRIVGLLSEGALPPAAAQQWRVTGHDLPSPHWVLDWEATPRDDRAAALPFGAVGLIFVALAAALLVRRRRLAPG